MANYTVTPLNSTQELNPKDIAILEGVDQPGYFTPFEDKVKTVVQDVTGRTLFTNQNFTLYTVENNRQVLPDGQYTEIKLDFDRLADFYNLNEGEYNITFEFNRPLFKSSTSNRFFISEISSDRTELRLDGDLLEDEGVLAEIKKYEAESAVSPTIKNFYLEFDNGAYVSAVNLLLVEGTLLVKLYEALPQTITLKDTTFLYTRVGDPKRYNLLFETDLTPFETPKNFIKGPNFNVKKRDQQQASRGFETFSSLLSSDLTSSVAQIKSILQEKDVVVNTDFTQFENFIHFSSAKQRLVNFYYKVSEIENYQNQINAYNVIPATTLGNLYTSESREVLQSNLNRVIENFDEFEYFMYFSSNSFAWPKTNSQQPFNLYGTGSTQVLTWLGSDNESSPYFGGRLYSASLYDGENKDNLLNTVPEYLREDPSNAPYELFVNMLGQHYDVLWTYTKGITDKLNSDNRPDFGAPKQLMGDILKSFGVRIYENQFANQDLFTNYLGLTPSGSLNYPTGSEVINTYVTASEGVLTDDYKTEIYKRLYHNLPYLLKKKGSKEGLQSLVNIFGIPDTILQVNEFGGKDTAASNDYDFYQEVYNYMVTLAEGNTSHIRTTWRPTATEFGGEYPRTIELSFRVETPPTESGDNVQIFKQNSNEFNLGILYTGTYTTSSYSGSIQSESRFNGDLTFQISSSAGGYVSASINAPFFNGNVWTTMITATSESDGSTTYRLAAGDSIYEGDDGTKIGHYITDTVSDDNFWGSDLTANTLLRLPVNATTNVVDGITYNRKTISYQELRYYKAPLEQESFKTHVTNRQSISTGYTTGEYEPYRNLLLRGALGGERIDPVSGTTGTYTEDSSHPAIYTTASFNNGNSDIIYGTSQQMYVTPISQSTLYDQPVAGIRNRVSDKIEIGSIVAPTGSVISKYTSIQQNVSRSYTDNVNYLEIGFSPQNQINEDIINHFGFVDLGEYLGDPRQRSSRRYEDLVVLSDQYFKKYTPGIPSYNFHDYFRLLKFFDNSLFKMIKDFTPARSGVATGGIIKQHLLERSKYPEPIMSFENKQYTASIDMYTVSGTDGGVIDGESTGYTGSTITPLGAQTRVFNDQAPRFTGELGGSEIIVTNGELNEENPFKNPESTGFVMNVLPTSGTILGDPVPVFQSQFEDSSLDNFYGAQAFYTNSGSLSFANGITDDNGVTKDNVLVYTADGGTGNLHRIRTLPGTLFDTGGTRDYIVTLNLLIQNGGGIDAVKVGTGADQTNYIGEGVWTSVTLTLTDTTNGILLFQFNNNGVNNITTLPGEKVYLQDIRVEDITDRISAGQISTVFKRSNPGPNEAYSFSPLVANISKVDNNGVSTRNALSNLNVGDKIKYNVLTSVVGQNYNVNNTVTGIQEFINFFKVEMAPPFPTGDKPVEGAPATTTNTELLLFPTVNTANFSYNDYNAILNNTNKNVLSTKYQIVDSTLDEIRPSNFDQLILGSGSKAQIPDSFFTSEVNKRKYKGTRLFNRVNNIHSLGDTSYGKSPVINYERKYGCYFNFLGGTTPDLQDKTGVSVKFYFDNEGNILEPFPGGTSNDELVGIVQQNFSPGSRVGVQLNDPIAFGTDMSSLNGTTSILKSAEEVAPVLFTELTSSLLGNLSFGTDSAPTASNDFIYGRRASGTTTITTTPTSVNFGTAVNSSTKWSWGSNTATLLEDTGLKFDIKTRLAMYSLTEQPAFDYSVAIIGSGSIGGWRTLATTGRIPAPDAIIGSSVVLAYPEFEAKGVDLNDAGNAFRVVVQTFGNEQVSSPEIVVGFAADPSLGGSGIFFCPSETYTESVSTSGLITHETGTGDNIISISSGISKFICSFQNNDARAGFAPTKSPIMPLVGDEIRFGRQESSVYQVTRVVPHYAGNGSSSGKTFITLDKNLTTSDAQNITSVLLRRYYANPGSLILDIEKPAGGTSEGFILPDYQVGASDGTLQETIQSLREKGIIGNVN